MAILGIGTDILDIDRVAVCHQRFATRFSQRLLTEKEQESTAFQHHPVRFLAKRFAVKEAILKAMGTGLSRGIRFIDIEVLNHANGRPFVELFGRARDIADELQIAQIHVSISDEKQWVVAYAVAEQ